MGDTSCVAAVAVKVVNLHFEGGKFLVLDDCLYVLDVRRNLVSVFCLLCNEMDIHQFLIKILFLSNTMMILYVVGCYKTIYTC